jgi:DNA repair protein RecN (Recombination protein N)
MLTRLDVENHALIAQVQLRLEPGFHAFTGETGSGKSILLGALSLLLGARAESAAVGFHSERAVVEGEFDAPALREWLRQHDLPEANPIVVRREVLRNGRSRAFINDALATAGQLKDLGNQLVDIHRQDDSGHVWDREVLCNVLDHVGGHEEVVQRFQRAWSQWSHAASAMERLERMRKSPQGDAAYLQHQVDQLQALRLGALDWEALLAELTSLSNAEGITFALNGAATACDDDDRGALTAVAAMRKHLQHAAGLDGDVEELLQRVESVMIELRDVSATLGDLLESKAPNPARLQHLRETHDHVQQAMSRHNVATCDELRGVERDLAQRIAELEGVDEALANARSQEAAARRERDTAANALTEARRMAAASLTQSLLPLLRELKMPHAQLEWEFTPCTPDAWGADTPELLFASNPGSPLLAMHKVASGGERSRFSLALKRVMAQALATPVVVLDEIDAGVSGEVAAHMGAAMQGIAHSPGTHQVLAVTHLAQVASMATHHWEVRKRTDGATTHVEVVPLSGDARVEAIAKMISGAHLTDEARKQAARLMERT